LQTFKKSKTLKKEKKDVKEKEKSLL